MMRVSRIFSLIVDYNQPFERMVVAGGYDWRNKDLTENRFPIVGEGVVFFEACYFHFDPALSSEEVVEKIVQKDRIKPWSPANVELILAYGMIYPNSVQRRHKYPVIGLGSVATSGDRDVPYLDIYDSGMRLLGLKEWDEDKDPIDRFLASRKREGA